MLRSSWDHYFQKKKIRKIRFSKLYFLRTVSFTTVANSEETKLKKTHYLYNFSDFFSTFCFWFFPCWFCRKMVLFSYPVFFSPSIKTKDFRIYVHSSKNLWNKISFFLYVFRPFWCFWMFLDVFTAVYHVCYGSCKHFLTKHRADTRSHPPT